MSRPIVVGVHPHRDQREAVELAVMLSCLTDAPLEVVSTFWFDSTPGRTARRDVEDRLKRELEEAFESSGACSEVRVSAAAGSAAYFIHETARRVNAGLIVVGSSSRGPVGGVALGSTTDKVLDGAPCPVAVAPRGFVAPVGDLERIGVAFVDTVEGRAALRGAASVAQRTGASLVAYTALGSASDAEGDEAQADLELAVHTHADGVDAEARVIRGGISGLIGESADLDLMVAGSRGHGPMMATVLGGVSRKLARQTACPLIVIPRGQDKPLADLFAARPSALSA